MPAISKSKYNLDELIATYGSPDGFMLKRRYSPNLIFELEPDQASVDIPLLPLLTAYMGIFHVPHESKGSPVAALSQIGYVGRPAINAIVKEDHAPFTGKGNDYYAADAQFITFRDGSSGLVFVGEENTETRWKSVPLLQRGILRLQGTSGPSDLERDFEIYCIAENPYEARLAALKTVHCMHIAYGSNPVEDKDPFFEICVGNMNGLERRPYALLSHCNALWRYMLNNRDDKKISIKIR